LKKRVLVTGGAGFIGSHLVKRLVAEGAEVVVIDDLSMGDASKVDSGAQLIALDVRSLEASRLIKDFKPDVVFHLAAQINLRRSLQQPLEDASINILGSINVMQSLVESAEDISKVKFVFSSTGVLFTAMWIFCLRQKPLSLILYRPMVWLSFLWRSTYIITM